MVKTASFLFCSIEINRVLLAMIVEPIESKQPASLKELLKGVLNDDDDDESEFTVTYLDKG